MVATQLKKVEQIYQSWLDRSTPHVKERWIVLGVALLLFVVRILWTHKYYIVCYALGIYLLNLFLLFLSPKIDPAADMAEEDVEEGAPGLPMSSSQQKKTGPPGIMAQFTSSASGNGGSSDDDEFRPFIRRLPEFKFWLWALRAVLISLVCTFIPAFDVPVFWPVLLIYFIMLFSLTMRRQIAHMRKYKYLPFDIGKTQYK